MHPDRSAGAESANMSNFGRTPLPPPVNEPIREYRPGSAERASLKAELARQAAEQIDMPLWIGGKEVRTGELETMRMPHAHQHVLGQAHLAGPKEAAAAIEAATAARAPWQAMSFEERTGVFIRAAHLLRDEWRDRLNASTMLGQSKVVYQAEIDAACELIDFLNFNVQFIEDIYKSQPISDKGTWNRLEYRPLDGFVFAVTPFNFTAIAANLVCAPALCGNTVVWKPSPTALHSAHYIIKLLEAAGLPPGVINCVQGTPAAISKTILDDPRLAGLNFTGSTATFEHLWRETSARLSTYNSYPRVVGETGGKDFVLAHPSANVENVVVALLRGAFEYQGQKCSAASRAYVPKSLWPQIRERLADEMKSIKVGDTRDFRNLMGGVIDARAFAKHKAAINAAREQIGAGVHELIGGDCDDSVGYFVQPTVIVVSQPDYVTMREELFGPILSVFVYDDARLEEILDVIDQSTAYALTGAIFSSDRAAIDHMTTRLRFAAGNFYINDKPTGAVVGQQPFGGSRKSGTNDKAGAPQNLLRWMSTRTIKENLNPPRAWRYPSMTEE